MLYEVITGIIGGFAGYYIFKALKKVNFHVGTFTAGWAATFLAVITSYSIHYTKLYESKNFLICIPTASGKTLIGEMALLNHILDENKNLTGKKGLFIVPLKALANEKFDEFREKYEKYSYNFV